MHEILIIGYRGYIGSVLFNHLRKSNNYTVTGIDAVNGVEANDLTTEHLKDFNVVINLAGLTNVRDCEKPFHEVISKNVDMHVGLMKKLDRQKYIYASTSSVYGGRSKSFPSKEDDFVFSALNSYDATKMMMDIAAQISHLEYYGLRFATVCGPSPAMRYTMLNAMVKAAMEKGEITAMNPEVNRPILCINELSIAIETIITGNDRRGIYNLASWNATVEEMAKAVQKFFKARRKDVALKEIRGPVGYDFAINTERFRNTYNFTFLASPQSVISDLYDHYVKIQK